MQENTIMHIVGLITRICGGTAGFMFAKGWGFYPASNVNSDTKKVFSHAYMQVVMIFLGEALTGIIPRVVPKEKTQLKFSVKLLYAFILPAILDGLAQTFSNLGIGGELISVQQFFRLTALMFQVPLSCMDTNYRISFNSMKKQRYVSIILQTCAFVIIGIASVSLTQDKQPDCGTTIMSMVWCIVSGVCSAFYGFITSKIYPSLDMHPLELSSAEGFTGLILYCVIGLPILSILKIETPNEWAYQHRTGYIIGNQVCFVMAVFTVTCGGYLCGKYANPVTFNAIEAARPTLVMLISMFAGFELVEPSFTLITIAVQAILILAFIMFFQPFSGGIERKHVQGQSEALVIETAQTLEMKPKKAKGTTVLQEDSDELQ